MARRAKAVAPGFTLIELVMVILILGITSIVILPRFSSSAVFNERGYFDDLLQSLQYARELTLARGCRVQAVLYTDDFYFMQDDDCDSSAYQRSDFTLPLMRPDQSTPLEFNDGGHQPLSAATLILVFEPTGMISRDVGGSLGSFDTLSYTVASRSLTVYGDTGYVE